MIQNTADLFIVDNSDSDWKAPASVEANARKSGRYAEPKREKP
jgi:hypothetical protein